MAPNSLPYLVKQCKTAFRSDKTTCHISDVLFSEKPIMEIFQGKKKPFYQLNKYIEIIGTLTVANSEFEVHFI